MTCKKSTDPDRNSNYPLGLAVTVFASEYHLFSVYFKKQITSADQFDTQQYKLKQSQNN